MVRRRNTRRPAALLSARVSTPGESDFSVSVSAGPEGRTVVAVAGEIDLVTAPALTDAVEERLERGPVLLDLRAVEFLDSSGVRALDRVLRMAEVQGRELTVARGLRPNVEQVLAMTGLLDVLPFAEAPSGAEGT